MFEQSTNRYSLCLGAIFIVVSLPLLIAIGVGAGYFGYLPIKIESYTFYMILFIFLIFIFFAPHNAYVAACKIKKDFTHMQGELLEALKENELEIMGMRKSTLNIRDFLEDYYKDIRDDNYAKVASSIFPMLGILGTFISIAISMPNFNVKDVASLDSQISVLLSGLATAFYVSIYGIFLSIWWIFLDRRGVALIEKRVIELESLYSRSIWKKSELIKHQHLQQELKDEKLVATLKKAFNIDFIKELNEHQLNSYKEILSTISKNFNSVSKELSKSAQELKEILEEIQTKGEALQALENIEDNLVEFNRVSHELKTLLENVDRGIDNALVEVDSNLARAVEKMNEMLKIVSKYYTLINR